MTKNKVLIIGERADSLFHSQPETESPLIQCQVTIEPNPKQGIAAINDGKFSVVVLCDTPDVDDYKKLEFVFNYLKYKPSIVSVINNWAMAKMIPPSLNEASFYVPYGTNLKENILFAIDAALKRCRLTLELGYLRDLMSHTQSDRNVVELTMAYNHEINNLLTAIIGNTQLMLKLSSGLDINIASKLEKIGIDAEKIREMAISLINIINAPSDSVPLDKL